LGAVLEPDSDGCEPRETLTVFADGVLEGDKPQVSALGVYGQPLVVGELKLVLTSRVLLELMLDLGR